MADVNNHVNWNALLDAIHEEKCVLCIGPGVFTDKAGASLDQQLLVYLERDGRLDSDIIVYPDGLFFFRKDTKRTEVRSELIRFYRQPFPNAEHIFKSLVHIPFNLIIFLTPDQRFAELAEAEKEPIQRDFYFKKKPPRKRIRPSKNNPLAYHILGSLEEDESLILTYDDLFDFLESASEKKSMTEDLHTVIKDARHFICLGLPLEKWYMQLLLRVLNLHTNKKLVKYASGSGYADSVLTVYQDQFDITFVPADILAFTAELASRCEKAGLLRTKSAQAAPIKERVRALIGENQLEDALIALCEYAEVDHDLLKTITNQQRRYKSIKREYDTGKVDYKEYSQECANIADAMLDMVRDFA